MIRAAYLFASILMFGCTIPSLAAACTAPPGAEGDITYNTTYKMMQFCDGTNWIAMAGPSNDGGGSGGAEACAIGDAIGSGYCAGSISGKDLIALPRGCAISAATIANCTGSDRSSSYQGYNEPNGTYEIEAFVDGDLAQAFALATDNGDNTENIAKYCASITIDGESWRAPTAPEMLMLYDSSPSLPAAAQLNSLTAGYWSANQLDNGNNAFYVDGDNWARLGTANSQGTTQRIRCVRTTEASGAGGGSGGACTPPPDCPNIGDMCDDDTIYLGLHPRTAETMFIPACDAGRTWNGASCTGTRTEMMFDSGASNVNVMGSHLYGQQNTTMLMMFDADSATPGFQYHQAAQYCDGLSIHGHSDWFLPAHTELSVAASGEFNDFLMTGYVTSTSRFDLTYSYEQMQVWRSPCEDGYQKSQACPVRCMRLETGCSGNF